jgi:hypothetical protein
LPEFIDRPLAGIAGCIPPDIVRTMRGEYEHGRPPPDDGGLDRFLFAWPDPLPAIGEQWREVSEGAEHNWNKMVRWLLSLKCDEQGDPVFVNLTGDARQAWEEATTRHATELNDPDFPPHLRGHWQKLRAYLGRLALLMQFLRLGCGDVHAEDVDGESVRRGEQLVNYFKAHARRAYVVMHADQKTADADHVRRWLERNPEPEQFTVGDVQRGLRNHNRLRKTENIEQCLELLELHGYIRRLPEKPGPGRPTRRFQRNPLWRRVGNPGNPQNPPG